jgi:hypothetical protein
VDFLFKLIAKIGIKNKTMSNFDRYNNQEVTNFNLQSHKEVAQIWTQEDSTLGIMKWGYTNSYPQSLINLIEQSPIAKPTVKRTSKFYQGAKFEGENEIISQRGLTLKNIVSIMADDYAVWEAFAIQCNYNLAGQVTSINPIRIADLRFNQFDELNYASKVGYYYDYGNNSEIKKQVTSSVVPGKIKWFNRFNPNAVTQQIENTEGGIGNYLGQVLYHAESGHSSYPVSPLQAPVNYVLSDVENSILVRKETSTGFISSYILKTSMDSEDPTLLALEAAIAESQGARGYGKVITFSGLDPETLNDTILEEIGAGGQGSKGVIESAQMTFELDHRVITGAYQIPPALAGVENVAGFSGEDLSEAYYVFNAITQSGRDTIEAALNRILSNSVFKIKEIKLNKLTLDTEKLLLNDQEQEQTISDPEQEAEAKANAIFADMTGKQMQGLQRAVRKYNKGEISRPQAAQVLQGFGLTEDQVAVWLDDQ